MDSPRPRSHHPTEDCESEHPPSATLSSLKWVPSINPIYKVLCVTVLSSLFAALVFSSLPLWRPIAALLLQKLMGFLKFLLVTAGIGLGILNSRLWRSTYTESDSVRGNGGKDDSVSSRVPFVGMFSSEMQHSYSFDEKEMEVSENGLMSRRETENDGGHDADTATMTAIAEADDDERNTPHISMPVMDSTSGLAIKENVVHERDDSLAKSTAQHDIKEDGAKYEEAAFGPSVHVPATITMNLTTKTKVKPYDDLGLAAVVAQQPSRIIHRRGSSLDFPIEKEWCGSKLGNYAATDQQCNLEVHKLSSSRKVAPSALNMIDHATRVEPGRRKASESSSKSNTGAGFPAASMSTTSKHNRSRSAYDLNELLVQQRPRNKSGTTSSELSKRRNTSLSCDLDKDYSNGGVPAWLSALPSPPEPPLVYGYGNNKKRVETREFDTRKSEAQDESSLRKAFSESLAPWRATTNALPVEIPISNKETKGLGDFSYRTESQGAMHTRVLTPPSSPFTPNSSNTMGSPSPGELNKKVDAFIARFHQQMRLQRLESLERSKQRGY